MAGRTLRSLLLVGMTASFACALAAGAGGQRVVVRLAKSRRLNVVVILSDDERLDGSKVMHDVNRLLADHGITFTDYHVTTSECGPSRASILTGLYSHHSGVLDNFGRHSYPAFDKQSNLAVWLHRKGYVTALVGKYLNDYTKYGHNEIPPGWNDWQAMDSIPMEEYYNYSINDNGKLEHYGDSSQDYSTTVLTRKAVSFIHGTSAHKPFFLYFAPIAPHLPAIPAKQDQGKLENIAPFNSPAVNEADIGDKPWRSWHRDLLKAAADLYHDHVRVRQLESLLSLDRSVKQVVDALRAKHELRNTVIVYTSDNGFLWGEHRLGGKIWPYEESTHVPLVVRTPWTRGRSYDSKPVLNIDLAPTISELAGVKPSSPVDGRSFVPLLHGKRVSWRKSYVVEYLGRNLLRVGGPPPYVAVHTHRYLYIEYRNGWRELYDLQHDPWQLDNVADVKAYAPVRAELHVLLHRLYAAPPTRASAA